MNNWFAGPRVQDVGFTTWILTWFRIFGTAPFKAVIWVAVKSFNRLWAIALLYVGGLVFGALAYMVIEDAPSYFESFWWASVTAPTLGYGDMIPKTVLGKCIAIILIHYWYVGGALFTANLVGKVIENPHLFTHLEQLWIIRNLRWQANAFRQVLQTLAWIVKTLEAIAIKHNVPVTTPPALTIDFFDDTLPEEEPQTTNQTLVTQSA